MFVGRLSAPKGIYDLFDAIPYVIERHPPRHTSSCRASRS